MLELPGKHQYFQTQIQVKFDIKKSPLSRSLRTPPKKMEEPQTEK